MHTQTDFEAWARLLLTRKVPGNFSYLINPEVVHTGAEILKRGGAFEVHLETPVAHERVFVTPLIPRDIRDVRVHAN